MRASLEVRPARVLALEGGGEGAVCLCMHVCVTCVCVTNMCVYVRKVKNSQARTGHQRGMGGRWTDDDDTHERHTDTNKLTRHTASWLPHTLSRRTHNSGPHILPVAPPSTPRCQGHKQGHNSNNRQQEVTCEARAACSTSSNLTGLRGTDETVCGV